MMFTCKYRDSEALLKAYYYKVKMRRSQAFAWVGIGLALACLGFFFASWSTWDLIVPVLGGYYAISQLLAPGKELKKEWAQLQYQYEGNLPEKVCTVDGTGIRCVWDGQEKAIAFADVLAVYDLKNAIVVASFDQVILLDKDGFTDGQAEQCRKFIWDSCPNCPHYKR